MTLADDLRAAKALIDTPEKWGKGNGLQPPHGCLCVITALAEVCDGRSFYPVEKVLADALPVEWHGGLTFEYNDDPTTTHADIMALFDRAIAAADSDK